MIEQPTFTSEEEKIIESLNYCIDYAARTGETSFIFQTPLPKNLIEYLEDNKYKVTVVKDGVYSISFGEKLYDIESCIAYVNTQLIEEAAEFGSDIDLNVKIVLRLYSNVEEVTEVGILYTGDEELANRPIWNFDGDYEREYIEDVFSDRLYCVCSPYLYLDWSEYVKDGKFKYWLRTYAKYIDKDGNEKIQFGAIYYYENLDIISISRPEKIHVSQDRVVPSEYIDLDMKKMEFSFLIKGDLITEFNKAFLCTDNSYCLYPDLDDSLNAKNTDKFIHTYPSVRIKDTDFKLLNFNSLFVNYNGGIGQTFDVYNSRIGFQFGYVLYYSEYSESYFGEEIFIYRCSYRRIIDPVTHKAKTIYEHYIPTETSNTVFYYTTTSNRSVGTFFDFPKHFISAEYRGYCSPLDGGVYNEYRDNLYDYIHDYYYSGINALLSLDAVYVRDTTDFSDIAQALNNRKYWYHYDCSLIEGEESLSTLEFLRYKYQNKNRYLYGDILKISVSGIDNFNQSDYTIRVNSDKTPEYTYNQDGFICTLFSDDVILPIDFETPYRVEFFKNDNPSEVQYVETTVLHNIATICLDESLTDEQKLHARLAMRMYINYKKYFNL